MGAAYLDLFDCKLTGTIPWEIAFLYELGKFPRCFLTCAPECHPQLNHTALMTGDPETLYLGDNQLTGSIPEGVFGEMPNLNLLSIPKNQLTGTIPWDLEESENLTCFAGKLSCLLSCCLLSILLRLISHLTGCCAHQ